MGEIGHDVADAVAGTNPAAAMFTQGPLDLGKIASTSTALKAAQVFTKDGSKVSTVIKAVIEVKEVVEKVQDTVPKPLKGTGQ